mmetsp:Transcript_20059/g.27004  ORF Transcript_20059/g.27004 Transcript_20059/m.27004 type:complete len:85 (+) Transcript_20059:45-299(+)
MSSVLLDHPSANECKNRWKWLMRILSGVLSHVYNEACALGWARLIFWPAQPGRGSLPPLYRKGCELKALPHVGVAKEHGVPARK